MAFSKLKKLRSMTFFELKNSSNTTANTPLTQVDGRIPCLFLSCLRRLRHYHKIKRLNIVIWFILRGFDWVLRSYLKVVVKQKKITRSRYALVIYDLVFLPRTEPQVVTQYGKVSNPYLSIGPCNTRAKANTPFKSSCDCFSLWWSHRIKRNS